MTTARRVKKSSKTQPKTPGAAKANKERTARRAETMQVVEALHSLGFTRLMVEDFYMATDRTFYNRIFIDDSEVGTDRMAVLIKFCLLEGHRLFLDHDHRTNRSYLGIWPNNG
jgi:hypothetical protein